MAAQASDFDEKLLSFTVADNAYAVMATDVREIVRRPVLTRVPQGPTALAGLMNFHGSAVPVVRLSEVLGLALSAETSATRVVVYGDDAPVGLLVDTVVKLDTASSGARATRRLDVTNLLTGSFATVAQPKKVTVRTEQAPVLAVVAEDTLALLSFEIAGQRFALPLEAITEAMSLPDRLAVVPRSDHTVRGMLEWRGLVLPVVSLSALLGLNGAAERENILICRLGDAMVGFVCGAIDGVLRVSVSSVEPVPAILQGGEGDAEIDAIARVGGRSPLVSILSPKRLFQNRDIGRAIGTASSERGEMQVEADLGASLQFVVFSLGDETFGLPLGVVEEIVQLPDTLTRVPHAPAFVAGVMNRRGDALPVIDLRKRFEANGASSTLRPRVIVLSIEQLKAGFIVDGVSEILRVDASAVSPAPTMPGDGMQLFDRITPVGDAGAMVLIVDPKELLDRAERDLLASFQFERGSSAPK